jgi:membrane-associated phospholipid phosphatase
MSSSLYWKIPLYLASTLTGLSRINDDAHYLSQAALGWSLAFLAAASVDQTEIAKRNFSLVPTFGSRGVGLQVVFSY